MHSLGYFLITLDPYVQILESGPVSIDFAKGKLTKKRRGAKLQVIEKKITGRSPLRFPKKMCR